MKRWSLLVFVILGLAGCDSADDSLDSALVGTWVPDAQEVRVVVTVDRVQPLIDLAGPTTGAIRVSGDDPATFRTLSQGFRTAERTSLTFEIQGNNQSYGLTLTDQTERWARDSQAAQYARFLPYTAVIFYADVVPFPFELDGATVRVTPTTMGSDTGRFVQISGELTLASRPLAAGEEAVVLRETFSQDGERLAFEPDGRLRASEPGAVDGRDGQWTTDGGRVRLQLPRSDRRDALDESFAYRVDGGVLSLDPARVACDQDTRLTFVSRSLLIPETVDTCRVEQTRSFRSARA